jgi:ammonia channel protein AmtB
VCAHASWHVQPWAAIVIGLSGGCVYVFASWLVANVLLIDDPLDAGAVHGFCGSWGLIVAAAFAHKPFVAQVYGDEIAAAGHGAPLPPARCSLSYKPIQTTRPRMHADHAHSATL